MLSLSQIFHYSYYITPKRVTSWRETSLRYCACGQHSSFQKMSQQQRAVGNTASELTGVRVVPQTSLSRDKRVTARPTRRYVVYGLRVIAAVFAIILVVKRNEFVIKVTSNFVERNFPHTA